MLIEFTKEILRQQTYSYNPSQCIKVFIMQQPREKKQQHITRCVAMPNLMEARWVGQNSSDFFAVCGPKYTKLSLPVWECPHFATLFSE